LKIESDIGQLLYVHVDLMLARKDAYERRTKDLFVDLGLNNPQYSRQYERYRALKKAVVELQGVRLSTGVLKVAGVEKTLDGLDYKVVFRKSAAPQLDTAGDEESKPVVIRHYAKRSDPLTTQAVEIVQHFHQLVHGVGQHEALSKELSQALTLLSQHGFERTKHIIQYAAEKAKDTNFKMQHFGAVLSYGSRAVADFDRSQRQTGERHPVAPPARSGQPAEQTLFTRGEARLAVLTKEQYQDRIALIKVELFRQIPFLAQRPRSGDAIERDMMRSRLVRQLDQEMMDLLPLRALRLPEPLCKIWPTYAFEKPETTD